MERCVASGLPASEWARLNHVNRTSLYRALEWFRDHEPEVLGGYDVAHAGDGHRDWYERVRHAAHESLLPAAPARPGAPVPAVPDDDPFAPFVELSLADLAGVAGGATRAGAVEVDLRTLTATVGPGADDRALAALLRAAASL